jgi:hypothetical protein
VLAQGVFEASQLHPQISDHPARRIVFAPKSPFGSSRVFCRDIQTLSVQKCTLLLPVNRLIKKLTRERVVPTISARVC